MEELDIIKSSIAEGKTKNSISQFRDFIESKSFDKRIETRAYYDKVILVAGRFSAIENEIRLGIIKKEDELVERNKINNDLLGLINEFPKVGDASHIPTGESLTQRVKNISSHNKFKYDLFLSFSSKDKESAIKLYESLVGYGLRVFISSEYFKNNIGASFQREIEYALKHSRSFLLFWTENARQSKWVEIEYMAFFQEFYMREGKERKFYIFWPQDNSYVALPLFLRQLQFTSNPRDLIFSIIQDEEARIKVENEKTQDEEKSSTKTEKVEKQKEDGAKAKAELDRKQKEDEAKAEKEKQQKEDEAKAEKEKKRKEKAAIAKAKKQKENEAKAKAVAELDKKNKEDEAKRKADWEKAKKLSTINSYEKFLAKYKTGRFVSSAKKNLSLEKNTKKRRDAITKKAYESNSATNIKVDSSSDGWDTIVTIGKFLFIAAFSSIIIIAGIHLIIYLVGSSFGVTYPGGVWDYVIVIGAVLFSLINTALNSDDL